MEVFKIFAIRFGSIQFAFRFHLHQRSTVVVFIIK